MLTDTHCHILSTEYYNPQSIIDNLSSSNIKRIIINGYNQISNEEVLKLINNQNVYGALGIHPDNISLNLDKELDYITQNINTKGIIAIGEIGLDYYHNDQNKEEQIKLLEVQNDCLKEQLKRAIENEKVAKIEAKYNRIWAFISTFIAFASLIATIVIAIVK